MKGGGQYVNTILELLDNHTHLLGRGDGRSDVVQVICESVAAKTCLNKFALNYWALTSGSFLKPFSNAFRSRSTAVVGSPGKIGSVYNSTSPFRASTIPICNCRKAGVPPTSILKAVLPLVSFFPAPRMKTTASASFSKFRFSTSSPIEKRPFLTSLRFFMILGNSSSNLV